MLPISQSCAHAGHARNTHGANNWGLPSTLTLLSVSLQILTLSDPHGASVRPDRVPLHDRVRKHFTPDSDIYNCLAPAAPLRRTALPPSNRLLRRTSKAWSCRVTCRRPWHGRLPASISHPKAHLGSLSISLTYFSFLLFLLPDHSGTGFLPGAPPIGYANFVS